MRQVPAHVYSFLFYATLCRSALVNRTIDDERGDSITGLLPTYLPVGAWSQGSTCPLCKIRNYVNTHLPFDGTWHDTTYEPERDRERVIQATFNGSAVYVFNLIAHDIPSTVTFTNLTFYIDDAFAGQYILRPVNGPRPTISYQVPVFTNNSLPHAEHTILIRTDGPNPSVVLFDSIVYTTEIGADAGSSPFEESTSTSISIPTSSADVSSSGQSKSAILVGSIVGTTVGVIAALLTLALCLCFLRRRRQLVLPLFRKQERAPKNEQRSSMMTTVEDVTSRSSLLSVPPTPNAPSPFVSSLNTSDGTSQSQQTSELVFAVLPSTQSLDSAPRTPPTLTIPPAHRADVPMPALSTTGTEHSLRLAELTQEIGELEASMRDIRGVKKKNRSTESLPRDGNVSIAVLRDRVARLRMQLEKERRLMAEAFPHEKAKRLAGEDPFAQKRQRASKERKLHVVS